MDLNKLEKFLKDTNQPKFRLEQIKKAIFQDGASSFSEISTISKELREILNKKINILSFKVEKVLVSDPARNAPSTSNALRSDANWHNDEGRDNKSVKALLKLTDNNFIETVLLSPRPNTWTACISSQVGCPLGCTFCATGKGGFKRNLTAEEITDQILFWRGYLKNIQNFPSQRDPAKAVTKLKIQNSTISNIVYMGMGEPMLNWENAKKSVEDLVNPRLFNFGSRSISISTVGVKNGIEKFLEEFSQVNLAISLHFADDKVRSKYIPANRAYNLENMKNDLQEYFKKSKRKIFMEYIMFEGLNDGLENAKKLAEYLKSIGNSYLLHVNLISYNKTSGEFKSSSKNKIEKFKEYLLQNKINATIRKSLGQEISGACGQLTGG